MKQVKVTILVDIDQDVYEDRRDCDMTDDAIIFELFADFNNAKIEPGLVDNFEVDSVEPVEVKA